MAQFIGSDLDGRLSISDGLPTLDFGKEGQCARSEANRLGVTHRQSAGLMKDQRGRIVGKVSPAAAHTSISKRRLPGPGISDEQHTMSLKLDTRGVYGNQMLGV
jgi:hypothetical protein